MIATATDTTAVPYIDRERLMIDCFSLAKQVIAAMPDLQGVIAIPRSGMFPATVIATAAGAKLYTLVDGEVVHVGHGRRLQNIPDIDGRFLLVDDSSNTGASMRDALAKIPSVKTAVVYATPKQCDVLDFHVTKLPMPHYFAWHLFGSRIVTWFAFDMDGVICRDPNHNEYRDEPGPGYESFLANACPLYLPRPHKPKCIITARLERYRDVTVNWLKRHRIDFAELVMGPWQNPRERNHASIAEWKASELIKRSINRFVESDPQQAAMIHQITNKTVICPTTNQVFKKVDP
jgi:hypoxanthine phosphoribosyltransferase/uncharacterized HAD superfamily protein